MDNPARIGKYELLDYLGGGMSRVYRARDTLIDRIVCVKILTEKADAEAKARFLQEARVAGSLNHDNVIRVYDFGEDADSNPFMVMEFLEGEDLRHLMKQGRTGDLQWKLKAALQIARALGHIHERKIIHRDIKPENIHVTANGVVKLMDFGIAKSEDVSLTRTGFTLGTPYYMAPEQVRGEAPTVQMDIYAFGVMTFELLTGIRPTDGETIEAIFYKVLYEPLDLTPLMAVDIPAPVRDMVARCTAKNPAERPRSFAEVCAALEAVLGDAAPKMEHATPPPAPAATAAVATVETAPSVAPHQARGRISPEQAAHMAPTAPAQVAATPAGAAPAAVAEPPAPVAASRERRSLVIAAGALGVGVLVLAVAAYFLLTRGTEQVAQQPDQAEPAARISHPAGDMVLVPGGEYLAGKDRVARNVPAFYIDLTEVTNSQYARFCQERGRPLPDGFAQDQPDLPVVNITYVDAQEFARWAGKRLPTMDEWEKAARGDEGLAYPWGADADPAKAVAGAAKLARVGSIPAGASPFGALDMLGNAWEFVDDPRTPTPAAVASFRNLLTPPPTATEPWYAMRGGSFNTPLSENLTWDSASVPSRFRAPDVGFRCARDVR
ncbi:MAG: bifunctional serine/threonine-protein kinase/formylglycine-generating enzyme family protein [bacterium]